MLSIHTNISSAIAQSSLQLATTSIDRAIERMTTGFRINHAADNAAGYSIATNMTSEISSYAVAEENTSMGIDLINTASENLNLVNDKLSRLRSLTMQSLNGTYGQESLDAMHEEANAIVAEINRTTSTVEYNGIKLLEGDVNLKIPDGVGPQKQNFIEIDTEQIKPMVTYTDDEVAAMTKLSSVSSSVSISSGEYSISSADELAKLAIMTNNGQVTGGTFVLSDDISLADYSSGKGWTPIGTDNNPFLGTFNGNGHTVSELYINRTDIESIGLFGVANEIINLNIENCDITGARYVGALLGYGNSISHCSVSGIVKAEYCVGGLAGLVQNVEYSSSATFVEGSEGVGGLVGVADNIENSYNLGDVKSSYIDCGGVAGAVVKAQNSFSVGSVIGNFHVGGFAGYVEFDAKNCYSKGDVSGNDYVGGFAGYSAKQIRNSYSESDVNAQGSYVGGFAGLSYLLGWCSASGNVSGDVFVGGLTGRSLEGLQDCSATGNVSGREKVGGLAGRSRVALRCSATGNVYGDNCVGGLSGHSFATKDSYCTGNVTGNSQIGGFAGRIGASTSKAVMINCHSFSKVSGGSDLASLVSVVTIQDSLGNSGAFDIQNCSAIDQNLPQIDSCYEVVSTTSNINKIEYDMTTWNDAIALKYVPASDISLQVGINSDDSSSIAFSTQFEYGAFNVLSGIDLTNKKTLETIDNLIGVINTKQVELGAVSNRLESVLQDIDIKYENLVSSRSTIKDADIAEVSSEYIRQQILQQASATLLSTANTIPSIALSLI